jgi:hypothetical protein
MSISNPRLQNPCTRFIDYKGDQGKFFFYDKEMETQIEVPIPIYFIVLDELSTISGFNSKNKCGIFSNEVHRINEEILRVKTFKGGEQITGLYKDIKDNIKAIGGKYTKSVYAMLIGDGITPQLVNFKFKGSAFSGWLDKKFNTDNQVCGIVDFQDEINGNTEFKVPIFKVFKMTAELKAKAIEFDKILQAYLKEYKAYVPEKEIAKAEASEPGITAEVYEPEAKEEWKDGEFTTGEKLPF